MKLREQWKALTVHDQYAVAMFVILFGIPGLSLLIGLIVMIFHWAS